MSAESGLAGQIAVASGTSRWKPSAARSRRCPRQRLAGGGPTGGWRGTPRSRPPAPGLLASSGGLGIIEAETTDVDSVVDVVFQGTLILVLFTDAAALNVSSWRKDAVLPGRLLGIGLPLTIALGAVLAALLFSDLSFWEAAIIAAIIAPTDAALGQAVISNPRVPGRIRQALDVESGLNDGVSLPFVIIFHLSPLHEEHRHEEHRRRLVR